MVDAEKIWQLHQADYSRRLQKCSMHTTSSCRYKSLQIDVKTKKKTLCRVTVTKMNTYILYETSEKKNHERNEKKWENSLGKHRHGQHRQHRTKQNTQKIYSNFQPKPIKSLTAKRRWHYLSTAFDVFKI